MAFLDDLREYLEHPVPAGPAFALDLAAHRRHLLAVLEQLEKSGISDQRIQELYERWSERVSAFAEVTGGLLLEGMAQGVSGEHLTSLIDIALSRELGIEATTGSKIKDREIDRVRVMGWRPVTEHFQADRPSPSTTSRYALEIRAVRRMDDSRVLTPIGKLVLELPDREAMRWLLTVEAALSRGEKDYRRLSRAGATKLLGHAGLLEWGPDASEPWPVERSILSRLSEMGLVEITDHYEEFATSYEILPEGKILLEEISSGRSTPFTVLAEALLEDETSAVLGRFRPVAALVQREGAAAATTRHARMVAHEIRNALVPVQVALGALYLDVDRTGEGALMERHRSAIDGGIDRIFKFVKEMVQVAARGAEPTEPFDVAPAIEGAIAAIAADLGLSVAFDKSADLPPLLGDRSRFTLAVVNLLRNAAQSRPDGGVGVRVAALVSSNGDEVVITVDDDGPGVPPGYREAIFRAGVSLRPGGSGEGLALVREVVEVEMGGRAACEESPTGGARFVLTFPMKRTS